MHVLDLPKGLRVDEISWYRSHVSASSSSENLECLLTSHLSDPENYLRPALWHKYIRVRSVIAVTMFVQWVVAILLSVVLYFRTATMSMDRSIIYILLHDAWCIVLEVGLVVDVLLAVALLTVHSKIQRSFDRQFDSTACATGETCIVIADKTSPTMCVIDNNGLSTKAVYGHLIDLMADPTLSFADMRRTLS